MNPLILVGFDLVVSAVLILLAMYVVWSRVQSRLNSLADKETLPIPKAPPQEKVERPGPPKEEKQREWAFGGITEQAATLKRKGCSLEQIAQRLQLPTREVEMMLAISEMGNTEGPGHGQVASFSLEPEMVHSH